MPPRIDEALPEASQSRKAACEKDGATATEPVVERNRQPTPDQSATEIRCGVHESQQPGGSRIFTSDAKLLSVEELSTIDDRLV